MGGQGIWTCTKCGLSHSDSEIQDKIDIEQNFEKVLSKSNLSESDLLECRRIMQTALPGSHYLYTRLSRRLGCLSENELSEIIPNHTNGHITTSNRGSFRALEVILWAERYFSITENRIAISDLNMSAQISIDSSTEALRMVDLFWHNNPNLRPVREVARYALYSAKRLNTENNGLRRAILARYATLISSWLGDDHEEVIWMRDILL